MKNIDYRNKKLSRVALYALLVVMVLNLTSCQKFLDIKRNSIETPILNAEDCQKLLNNTGLNYGYPSDGVLSSDGYYVEENEYNDDNNIKLEDRMIFTWNTNAIRPTAEQWDSYRKIYTANVVLEYLEKFRNAGGSDPAALDHMRGQALFIRAYTHWQMAQIYCKPYTEATASADIGIELKLESDINEKTSRGTVQQTYDRVLQDLQEAVKLLPTTFLVPTRPNKTAAYAMLARVYQSMEKYPEALENATAALGLNKQLVDFNTLDGSVERPFEPLYNKEIIFHSVITGNGSFLLTPKHEGNGVARIDLELVNSFAENDLRKEILLEPNTYYDAALDQQVPDGSYRFSGNYEPTNSSELFNGLAVDELYLIRAESYARAGNAGLAMADLNMLLTSRWKVGTYVPMSVANADEALIKVLEERRKEMIMRGMRWTDLRRLNKDSRFARTLTRTVLGVTYTLPPNDPRYTLLIPQEVITKGKLPQNVR